MRLRARLSLFFAVGCVLGLAWSACGKAKPPYGTSLFITVRWDGDLPVYSLLFIGQVNEVDVFPRSLRPDDAGTPKALTVPEKVRVLLADDIVGQAVDVQVLAYDAEGFVIASGRTLSPVVVQGDEVEVTVALDERGTDAGVDAGADAGAADAGPCSCATTCCLHQQCAQPTTVTPWAGQTAQVVSCGATGLACKAPCDPMRANACRTGNCACGAGPQCAWGMRCSGDAGSPATCVCDLYSRCPGCCVGNVCVAPDAGTCGNGGNACTACLGACSSIGICSANIGIACVGASCLSGSGCVSPGFPTCKSTANNRGPCVACDVLRSNACRSVVLGSDCACGLSNTCGELEYCDRTSVPATCRPLLQ